MGDADVGRHESDADQDPYRRAEKSARFRKELQAQRGLLRRATGAISVVEGKFKCAAARRFT